MPTWTRAHRLWMSALILGVAAIVLATHPRLGTALWTGISRVPPGAAAAALSLVLCQMGLQCIRLWAVLPPTLPLSPGRTVYACAVGEWFSTFTPARAGEAVKVVLLRRAEGGGSASLLEATGALLADKLVDVGTMLILCVGMGLPAPYRALAVQTIRPSWPALAVVIIAGTLLLGIWRVFPRWQERLREWSRELRQGLVVFRRPRQLARAAVVGIGVWLAEVFAVRVLCAAFGVGLDLPRILAALVVLNIGILIPIAVANVVVYEGLLGVGLNLSGVPLPTAVVIATAHHVLELLGTTVLM